MILTQEEFDAFTCLTSSQREEVYEAYRIAPPASPTAARREAEALLGSLCQTVLAASWTPGFEAEAWTLVHRAANPGAPTLDHDDPAGEADVRELRTLTIEAGWWPIFDHPNDGGRDVGRAVPLHLAAATFAARTRPEGARR